MNHRQESSNISQSAVSRVQAGGNIDIGDITQNIHLSSDRYNHIQNIISEYEREQERLEQQYKSNDFFKQTEFRKKLNDFWKKLKQDLEDYQIHANQDNLPPESRLIYERKIRESESDINILWNLISPEEQILTSLLHILGRSSQADIFWKDSIDKLNYQTRIHVENLRKTYESDQKKLEEELNQGIQDCHKKRNIRIYEDIFLQKLSQDGYPLGHESLGELKLLLQRLNIDQKHIESYEKNLIKPFYKNNLQTYQSKYELEIQQSGYPLQANSIALLKEIKNSLSLECLFYSDLDLKSTEEKIIRPYYQGNLQKYKQEYKHKIERDGYPLSSESLNVLQLSKAQLGLETLAVRKLELQDKFSPESDIKKIESLTAKPFYANNLQRYEQKILQRIAQEGYFIPYGTCDEIQNIQKSLGLKNEDAIIVSEFIKQKFTIKYLFDSKFEHDYWNLGELLAESEWQKADELTRTIILKVACQESNGKLDKEAIKNFPSIDLFIIDQLWIIYSKGYFGLSIQKKIFDDTKQNRQNFAEQIGWSKGIFAWKTYSELTFKLSAPKGHLPVWGVKDKKIISDDYFHFQVWNFGRENSILLQPSSVMSLDFSHLPEATIFAFYGALFAMAASDGLTAFEELSYIFESMEEYNVPEHVKKNLSHYRTSPPNIEHCLNGLSLVNEEIRWDLLFHLMQVSLVDKILDPAEEKTIQLVQLHLNVTNRQLKAVQNFVQTMLTISEETLNTQQIKKATQAVITGLIEEGIPVPKAFILKHGDTNVRSWEDLPWKKIGKFALGTAFAFAAVYGISRPKF